MTVIVDEPVGFVRRICLAAQLFWAKNNNRILSSVIVDLRRENSALRSQRDQYRGISEDRGNDRDVLQGLGVEHQQDGSWRFSFGTLFRYLTDEDMDDVYEAIKKRK